MGSLMASIRGLASALVNFIIENHSRSPLFWLAAPLMGSPQMKRPTGRQTELLIIQMRTIQLVTLLLADNIN